MKYENGLFYGVDLCCSSFPYKKVINNGCTIETQDAELIRQLAEDERKRANAPVDWWLFKVGKTVLIDNRGIRFLCTMNNNGQWIRLDRIK